MSVSPKLNLVRIAGLVTWLVSGMPALVSFGMRSSETGDPRFVLWLGAFMVFGVAFWWASRDGVEARASAATLGLLAIEALAALSMFSLVCTWFESALLVVVAAQLGLVLRIPAGVAWILGQTALLWWLARGHWGTDPAASWALLLTSLQATAFLMASLVGRQVRHRRLLAQTNAELRATRELLAESSRVAERLRIARDLHDLAGHHLTALSLNLETASHLTEGEAREAVVRSRDIAKQLLAEVRQTVSALRQEQAIDVTEALEQLVTGIETPQIHLSLPGAVEVEDPERATALVRCVQEIITNAIRHSGAQNLWIEILHEGSGLGVRARDDGRGVEQLREGNGLAGMRERLEVVGGWLAVEPRSDEGFRVEAWLPLMEST